ncbi:hypothetical protein SUGI_0995890 [Cryptomeria japonica]|uniref:uncharacterized protein LOC131060662 isoform X1 n=1 Tax=Cryptomeria japonica TaxID=3369 RepID=UPI002414C722|nr:uncharacterized protein LOC131060662 isoform X1 [Cryptomeria japonica]GLJ47174.1 hypothetical protein SUGI_0995890 [Cryptomeria japonica]
MSRKRAAYTPPLRSNMDDKHASLMQDYLLLQDEYVSLKDQLQTAKLRKTTLLAEVRFLRQRLKMLKYSPIDSKGKESSSRTINCESSIAYTRKSASQAVAPDSSSLSPKNKSLDTTEVPIFWDPHKVIVSEETVKWEGVNDNIGLVSAPRVSVFRNGLNTFATATAGKRKISREDQISLECN